MTCNLHGEVEQARLERAIEYVRHVCLNGMPGKVAMPERSSALGYAMVATAAVYEAALNSVMPGPDSLERTIEIVREWYDGKGGIVEPLEEAIGSLNRRLAKNPSREEVAIEYVNLAAVALRLSVQAGDFV